MNSELTIVECLKCVGHYIEKTEFIEACPHCGNKDQQQTSYLSPEGKYFWKGAKELNQ